MKVTLGQALQKGIEAHKAKVQEADCIILPFLKANPNIQMLIIIWEC